LEYGSIAAETPHSDTPSQKGRIGAGSDFAIQYARVMHLPKVANLLGLVTPNGVRPLGRAFRYNRAARAYVMGPIVEPQRYLQRRCSIMNVYT